jgi:modulator of FtsH protease
MSTYQAPATRPVVGVLTTNKVIKNTFILLSMTLFFSAIMAGVAMQLNVRPFMIGWMGLLIWFGVIFGMTFVISALRNSPWALVAVFAFTGFLGFSLGPILNLYLSLPNGNQIVMTALGMTGVITLGLAGYALTTRKDFSFMGGFLMAGLLLAAVAILVNLFLQIPMLSLVISSIVVLLMAGMILFDVSRLVHGGETNYVMATVSLYLNIYVMFTHLLNLVAIFSGED